MQTSTETMTAEEIKALPEMTADEAKNHPAFSHSRQGTAAWRGQAFYYFHCSNTETGVHAVNVKTA